MVGAIIASNQSWDDSNGSLSSHRMAIFQLACVQILVQNTVMDEELSKKILRNKMYSKKQIWK